MAYMTHDGKGPYPCQAGEYCGNHTLDSLPIVCNNETQEDANRYQQAYLAKMRFGRPRPCEAGTTTELEARGMVGLYLREDQPVFFGGQLVNTPPELMEPEPSMTGER